MTPAIAVVELTIPADRVERGLLWGAFPGFHGNIELSLGIMPVAANYVVVGTIRNETVRSKPRAETSAATETDTERERIVRERMPDLRARLKLRMQVIKITGHFHDGKLEKVEVSEQ